MHELLTVAVCAIRWHALSSAKQSAPAVLPDPKMDLRDQPLSYRAS